MKRLLFLLLFITTTAGAESYVHINGVSKHNKAGYNEQNWGAGYEQSISKDWTVAAGAYKNSEYRYSTYAYGRYALYKQGQWDVGVNIGAVTGYAGQHVVPVALPEVCYGWVCSMIIPQVGDMAAGCIAARLRIPIN